MNTRYLRMFAVLLALFFMSSCAVFVRDGDYHHRGYWRRHSSLEQSDPAPVQMTAQNSGEAQGHDQVSR
jgi:hypothetical protein